MSVTAGLNVDYVVHIAYSFLIQVLVDGFIAKKMELNYKYMSTYAKYFFCTNSNQLKTIN